MLPPDAPAPAPRNRLLAALPPADLARLWPRLETVELAHRQTLHAPEEAIAAVYFPEAGYLSRLAPMDDGDSAEVGLIGPEGMAGLAVLLVEQNAKSALGIADTGVVLNLGKVVATDDAKTLAADEGLRHAYLGF